MKVFKNLISIALTLCMLFNVSAFVLAENNELVYQCEATGSKVIISGYGKDVKLFVLNPGKTIEELKTANSEEVFKEIVNYTNTINVGKEASYSKSVTINNYDASKKYIVYVKDKTREFSQEIGSDSVKIYVSKNAAANGNGSEAAPFKTIEEARNYVRTLNKELPIDVIIKGGEYNITSEIVLSTEDSGTEAAPITYKAAPGEKVVFNGSTKLDISKVKKVTDGNILGRVDSKVTKHLVEIDLSEQGIPKSVVNYLSNHLKGWYGKPIGVYLNNEYQNVARWPNAGYATTTGSKQTDGIYTFSLKELDSDRVKKWEKADNMYIEGYLANFWAGEWAKVASVDASTKSVTLADTTSYGVSNNMRAAAVNLLEEIDIPGEWYADHETMKMYYYPPHPLTEDDTLEISTLERNFISLEGAKYINIDGIEFCQNANSPSYFDESPWLGNAILVNNTNDIGIKNCKFSDIGMSALFIQNSYDVIIDSCSINNTGFSGVTIKNCGDRKTLTSSNITVSNSYISNASRDSARSDKNGVAIGNNCVGITVENNVLANMKNSAIRYYGNSHTIRNNEIYNCVKETSDAGAIYAGRSWSQYGTVISNNYFHHIGHGLDANGASALFLDDAHSGDTFTGNIVDMNGVALSSGIAIAGGRDVTVTDNIFVNALYSVRGRDRNITFSSKEYTEDDADNFYNSEIFQSFKGAAADTITNAYYITEEDWLEPFTTTFSKIMENFEDLIVNKVYKEENVITDNISFNSAIDIREKMTADSIIDRNYTPTNANTAFVDAENGDYRLTNEYKASLNISANVPDEDFLLDSIGIQTGLEMLEEDKKFDLIYPLNNDTVSYQSVNLKWNKSDFADKYIYEISQNANFATVEKRAEVLENTAIVEGLLNNTQYYWRVKAINQSKQFGYEVISDSVFSFKTADSVVVDNVEYNSAANQILYRLTNNKTETNPSAVKVIAALKNTTEGLIEVISDDVDVDSKTSIELSISTAFTKIGDIIEFYVWDIDTGMIGLTAKHVFDK